MGRSYWNKRFPIRATISVAKQRAVQWAVANGYSCPESLADVIRFERGGITGQLKAFFWQLDPKRLPVTVTLAFSYDGPHLWGTCDMVLDAGIVDIVRVAAGGLKGELDSLVFRVQFGDPFGADGKTTADLVEDTNAYVKMELEAERRRARDGTGDSARDDG
jgi:hypothetical protein